MLKLNPKILFRLLSILFLFSFFAIRLNDYQNPFSESLLTTYIDMLKNWDSSFPIYYITISILIVLLILVNLKLSKLFLIATVFIFDGFWFFIYYMVGEIIGTRIFTITSIPFFIFSLLLIGYSAYNLYVEKHPKKTEN